MTREERVGAQRRHVWLIGIAILLLLMAGTLILVSQKPSTLANGADFLRGVIGDRAVAQLEVALCRLQDSLQGFKYRLGMATPALPWTPPTAPSVQPSPTASLSPTQGAEPIQPPTTPTPARWPPAALPPLGNLKGEGVWSQYIQDAAGVTVAYRTYLQPDPDRRYAIVALVAFDLSRTRLHFVLGSVEPVSPNVQKRSGAIPQADRASGLLLAMFNGGFKARHGQFGAMSDGMTALPPKDGLGTLAIYRDGSVRIGAWGSEITASPDLVSFRQNGPLVIHQGEINPRVYDNSPKDWGYTIGGAPPTWRSGVGLSPDQKTLYYLCGPSLTMESLAKSMQVAGMSEAIQLDINRFWVHFVAVRTDGKKLLLEALFPNAMWDHIDRYLSAYTRDFFYVTGMQ